MGDDSRIKVLMLIKGLGIGGAERLLLSGARVRDRDGFAYEVAHVLPWKDALAEPIRAEGVPVECIGAAGDWDLRWLLRLRRRLRERPVDVLHTHSPLVAALTRPVVRSLPAGIRPKLVTTEHVTWTSYRLLTRALNRLTFRMDDAHLAVSEEVRDAVPRPLRDDVRTLVHGVVLGEIYDARRRRREMRQAFGLEDGHVVVGTIANFRRQKAYPDLLEAAKVVLEGDRHVRFITVGQGPLEREIRSLHAELGLGDRFLLLGQRDDALAVMSACDVFVLASHYEGYPVAVMEALALGLPLVATRVGGVPDAVREGVEGLLVPPGRPDLLAARVLDLARDAGARHRMGAAAAERGRMFDIANAVRETESLYRAVVAHDASVTDDAGG